MVEHLQKRKSFLEKSMKQTKFSFLGKERLEHGGDLQRGKRKVERPLVPKKWIHLTLKRESLFSLAHQIRDQSETMRDQTQTKPSPQPRRLALFAPGNHAVENLLYTHAHKFGIEIGRIAMNWNHVHIYFKIPSRKAYNAFIRTVTAALARSLSRKLGFKIKNLFDLRPYTRILKTWKEFTELQNYFDENDQEARGILPEKEKAERARKKKKRRPSPRKTRSYCPV
jgi:REP element-mobilizing transposase RayT